MTHLGSSGYVVLRCQRTGVTSPRLGTAHPSTANFLSELQGNPRYATMTAIHRNTSARPRNLYKFILLFGLDLRLPRKVTKDQISLMVDRNQEMTFSYMSTDNVSCRSRWSNLN